MEIVAVPAIGVLCGLFAQLYKAFINKNLHKHIPALCGLFGLILGVLAFFVAPDLIPAENVFVAAAIGIVSGCSATCVNQIYKQQKK